jgi:hypothetical protein
MSVWALPMYMRRKFLAVAFNHVKDAHSALV